MMMSHVEKIIFGLAKLGAATPAIAGPAQVPAPVAGIGIGAVILGGVGYWGVKRRVNS